MIQLVLIASRQYACESFGVRRTNRVLVCHVHPLPSLDYTLFSGKTQASFVPGGPIWAMTPYLWVETHPGPARCLHDEHPLVDAHLVGRQTYAIVASHERQQVLAQSPVTPGILKRHWLDVMMQYPARELHADI